MAVASTPASSAHGTRSDSEVSLVATSVMTSTSTAAHPTHCARLSTVGSIEARRPSSPRSSAMAGAPVAAPGTAAAPSRSEPRTQPSTIAASAAGRLSGGRPTTGASTKTAAAGSVSVTPRDPHSEAWSRQPSCCGGMLVRSSVSGASLTCAVVAIVTTPYAGMTRTGSGGRRRGGRPLSPVPGSRVDDATLHQRAQRPAGAPRAEKASVVSVSVSPMRVNHQV
jgi:hypothetical protein